jgi:hypothetical protein
MRSLLPLALLVVFSSNAFGALFGASPEVIRSRIHIFDFEPRVVIEVCSVHNNQLFECRPLGDAQGYTRGELQEIFETAERVESFEQNSRAFTHIASSIISSVALLPSTMTRGIAISAVLFSNLAMTSGAEMLNPSEAARGREFAIQRSGNLPSESVSFRNFSVEQYVDLKRGFRDILQNWDKGKTDFKSLAARATITSTSEGYEYSLAAQDNQRNRTRKIFVSTSPQHFFLQVNPLLLEGLQVACRCGHLAFNFKNNFGSIGPEFDFQTYENSLRTDASAAMMSQTCRLSTRGPRSLMVFYPAVLHLKRTCTQRHSQENDASSPSCPRPPRACDG